MIAEVGSELAFRRYLTLNKVPYTNLEANPFSDPDRFVILLGGRRCKLINFILTPEDQFKQVRVNLGILLDAQALVSKEHSTFSYSTPDDIYIFSFLNAKVTPDNLTTKQAFRTSQPIFLVHTLSRPWSSVDRRVSLGLLTFDSENSPSIKLDVNGLDLDRLPKTETVEVGPSKGKKLLRDYYTLNYLSTLEIPNKSVQLHSSSLSQTHFILPMDWKNLWVYGMEIIFTGYLTREEYHNRAKKLLPGSHVFQEDCTKEENLALPIRELRTLSHLFDQAKIWRKSK